MKLLAALLLLLLPYMAFSQVFFSTEFDPKNAIVGSDANPPAYDGVFNLGFRERNLQIQISYENFKAIDFYSIGVRGGYIFNHERDLNFVLLGGLGWIKRNVNWLQKVLFLSADLSAQVEYHLGKVVVFFRPEIRFRGGLNKPVYSNYGGVGYKF